MSSSYNTIGQLHSDRKSISVINYKGRKCVIKIYGENEKPQTEARIMRSVSMTGYAPEVIESRDNYLICEFIEGQSFAEAYRHATMSDDEKALVNILTEPKNALVKQYKKLFEMDEVFLGCIHHVRLQTTLGFCNKRLSQRAWPP